MLILSVTVSPLSVTVTVGPDDAESSKKDLREETGRTGNHAGDAFAGERLSDKRLTGERITCDRITCERFVLSPGEWKRLNRELGYDPDAGIFLSPGQPVDETIYDALRMGHDKTSALRDAGALLSHSDKSSGALARRLREKGHSPEAAEWAIARLKAKGLLDDAAAARRYAEGTVRRSHAGRKKIAAALVSHGFSREDAKAAAEAVPPEDYREALEWHIARKFPWLREGGADRADRDRAVAALLRQGFTTEEIFSALKKTDRTERTEREE